MTESPLPGDAQVPAVPDPRDRRKGDRRGGADRRAGTEPPAGVERRQGDRRGPDRRAEPRVPPQYRANVRSINEYPLDPDELEFINTVQAYRQRHQRPFPTWSEVLHILKYLGYRKVVAPGWGDGADEDDDAAEAPASPGGGSPGA